MASSSIIGTLSVVLGLDSAAFTQGARKSQNTLRDLGKQFAIVSAGAAALGASFAAMARQAITSANEIQNLSRVSNAAPEMFQKWAAASQTVGIEQEKLADILKDVTDRIGDFVQTGGGPMADFFENIAPKVGVTADEFARLSGPEALQLYVSSLEKAGVSQADMTFYLEAMASDVTALIPLLKNGGAEMTRLGEEAAAVGAVMDSQTIAALARTDEALKMVGLAFTGVRNIIGAAFAPAMEGIARAFLAAMREGSVFRNMLDTLAANMQRLGVYVATAVAAFGTRYVAALVAARLATLSLAGALTFLRGALIRTGFGALIVAAGEMVYQFTRLVTATGGFAEALTFLGDIAALVWQGIIDSSAAIPPALSAVWLKVKSEFYRFVSDLSNAWADFLTFFKVGLDTIGATEMADAMAAGPILSAQKAASDALVASGEAATAAGSKMAEAGAVVADAFGPAIDKLGELKTLTEGMEGSVEPVRTLGATLDDTGGAAAGAGGSAGGAGAAGIDKMAQSMKNATTATEDMGKKFGDLAADVITGTRSMADVLQQFAKQLLSSSLGGLFNSIIGGGDKLTQALGAAGAPVGGGGFLSGLGSLLGFKNGGQFQVGGIGGVDSQLVAFKASPNETVSVTKPGQEMGGGQVFAPSINIAGDASEKTVGLIERALDHERQQFFGRWTAAQKQFGNRIA